jgi:predicted GNAT family acetyltransferase
MSDGSVQHEEDRQRFVVRIEGEEAELTYTRPDDHTLDLRRTFTPPLARGKGVAGALVEAALEYARASDRKVIPSCPYVAAYLDKHPEHADLRY